MLAEVIVDDQGIPTGFHEIFANGTTGVRSDILHRGRFRSRSSYDDRMIHGLIFFQGSHNLGDAGALLPNSDINTNQIFVSLVDNGIDAQGRFARLAVANNQLPLPTPDRDHRVDTDNTGLNGPVNIAAFNHARGNSFQVVEGLTFNRSFAINWVTNSIDHTANQGITHRH